MTGLIITIKYKRFYYKVFEKKMSYDLYEKKNSKTIKNIKNLNIKYKSVSSI